MFRKLLFLLPVTISLHTSAQVVAAREYKADTTDYKLLGAPMPLLKAVKFTDTSKKKPDLSTHHAKRANTKRAEIKKALVDDGYFTNRNLDNGANLFIMMFNPYCGHCEDVTQMLEQNSTKFKKSKIVLLANATMIANVPFFATSNRVPDYPALSVATDSSGFIDKVFVYKSLPQINIYNSDRKLIKIFNGDVSIDSIQVYIQ